MLRILICLAAGLALAMVMLLLRQQRLEMQNQCNALHDQMLRTQTTLWRQQVQVAAATAPAALETALARHDDGDAATPPAADGTARGSVARPGGEWGVLTRP